MKYSFPCQINFIIIYWVPIFSPEVVESQNIEHMGRFIKAVSMSLSVII